MPGRHPGRAITGPQRRRWIAPLTDAADEAGPPGGPEFRAAFAGYIEWGHPAGAGYRPGAVPVEDAPVPRWGRGVAPPWPG